MPNKDKRSDLYLEADPDKKDAVGPSPIARKAIVKMPVNMALYDDNGEPHEVVAHVIKLCQSAKQMFETQRQNQRDQWKKADEFYWMAQKEYRMPEMTRAKTSAGTFYRACRRLADGAFLASFSDEMPVKFLPETSVFDIADDKQKSSLVCEGLNQWAAYCMQRTKFREKAKRAYYQVYKYADFIAYVPYDYQIEIRKRYEPVDVNEVIVDVDGNLQYRNSETGEIGAMPFPPSMTEVEYEYVSKDEVGFEPLPIENCYLDNRIEDIDRQTFFIRRTDITRPEMWAEARAGKFQNIGMVGELQKYQLYNMESDVYNQRVMDANKTTTDSLASEIYERWQCWVLLPKIEVKKNKKGEVTSLKWDQNAPERRYVLDLIGPINGKVVVARFSESPYWGDGVPFIHAWSHEDDSGFYHRGLVNLLEDNMTQEQVAKGQIFDSRTLLNFRPLVRQQGRVKNKDCKITHNTVFDVVGPNALQQLEVSDLAQSNAFVMQMIRDDSETIAQTPPFMLGQSMGGRTSATEFAAIQQQSSAPAFNDIRALNMQIAGGYMRKVKEYAPQFLDKDVMLKLNSALVQITPDEFASDMNIVEVGVQSFENQATKQQILINLLQVTGGNPMLQGVVNPVGLWVKICAAFRSVFPNPEELLLKNPQVSQALLEYQRQRGAMQEQVRPDNLPQVAQGIAQSEGEAQANPVAGAMGASKGA